MQKIALTKEFLQQALSELDKSGMDIIQLFPEKEYPIARIAQNPDSSGSYPMSYYHTRMDDDRDYNKVLVFLKG